MSLRAIRLIADERSHFGPIALYVSSQLLVEYIQNTPLGRTVVALELNRGNSLQVCLALRRARPEYLLFMLSNGSWKHSVAAMIIDARVSIGSARGTAALGFNRVIDMRRPRHKTELCLEMVELAAKEASIDMPATHFAEPLLHHSPSRVPITDGGRTIVFACGSGEAERHKRWPAHRFADLGVRMLRSYPDVRFVVLGSKAEKPLSDAVVGSWPTDEMWRISAVTPASIQESLQVLRSSALLVSGCTGTAHMAAATGIPIVGIYGPTNPRFTGPLGTRVWIVRKDYGCAPCYRNGFVSGCGQPRCITDISVEEDISRRRGHTSRRHAA